MPSFLKYLRISNQVLIAVLIAREAPMEKVTIQEASHRLNLSQAVVRDCVRNGQLKAFREDGPRGQRWMVELPEDGWVDDFTASLHRMAGELTPWWWADAQKRGKVHYVEDLGIEEIEPLYLCGLKGENVWGADGHTEADRCPDCVTIAKTKGLPMWS